MSNVKKAYEVISWMIRIGNPPYGLLLGWKVTSKERGKSGADNRRARGSSKVSNAGASLTQDQQTNGQILLNCASIGSNIVTK